MEEIKKIEKDKPDLSPWQILNMSVGFFGIQHGFEIQFARMSSIYEQLGADPSTIPMLWLAAPMTGLIIQPIIGYMSDRTWISPLRMRRRPYFMIGAILATIALFLMPNSSSLWMAAGLLWVLDASLNISMEPFRAFVADKTNEKQRSNGFAMQTLMIGLGTDEYPPDKKQLEEQKNSLPPIESLKKWFKETTECFTKMPEVMKKLAWVQFFTWMGLYCFWIFYSVAVARYVFGASDPNSDLYQEGIRFGAHTMMIKGFATPLFALMIPWLTKKMGIVNTHAMSLIGCGLGFLAIPFIGVGHHQILYIPMVLAGIGWAAITSLPYIILSDQIPKEKYGIYMGIFNMFIVIPEILVSLGLSAVIMGMLNGNQAYAVGFGGVLLLIASGICPLLKKKAINNESVEEK